MDKTYKLIAEKLPCREEIIATLIEWLEDADAALPSCVYLYGHPGTGKTAIIKEFLRRLKKPRKAYVNCVECYAIKILLENILDELLGEVELRCDNLKDFVQLLRHKAKSGYSVIVVDNAERLRDMEANILPSFLRLQQLAQLNVCVVLVSQLPFEKFYCKTGLTEISTLYFPQYTKSETLRILSGDYENAKRLLVAGLRKIDEHDSLARKQRIVESITPEFFNNYLNLFLSVFYKACRDLTELKTTAHKCFATYLEPVLDGSIEVSDASRLWRHISGPLRTALSQVYIRYDQLQQDDPNSCAESSNADAGVQKLAQSLELPYYGKYLLIAAFLASHNSAKEDKRLFVKHHGKTRKTAHGRAKVSEKFSTSLGPKSFTVDRLLAIFYAILEEKVGLTCNLLSQISTLVHLKLLSFVSGENNIIDGSARLQCTVGLEFVLYIGKVVGFNVRQYLCDFM